MATAGAIVAAAALPLGFAAWASARHRNEYLLPWKPWRVPWGGFEVLAVFLVVAFSVPAAVGELTDRNSMAASMLVFSFQAATLVVIGRLLFPSWNPFRERGSYAGLIAVAVVAWLVLAPVTLGMNAIVGVIFSALDWQVDEHPLTKRGGDSAGEQALFLIQACVAAPWVEEILFRGVLLPWVIGGRLREGPGVTSQSLLPPAFRPWIVLGVAVLICAQSRSVGPLIFAGFLTVGLVVLWATVRHGRRHIQGVYSTAALFAVFHVSVWPSPVPLFVFGLGLGWLAVRTRGFVAPAIVHGLFNAISAVYVLRGGTT